MPRTSVYLTIATTGFLLAATTAGADIATDADYFNGPGSANDSFNIGGGSQNSVFRNVPPPANFNVSDIGQLVSFARQLCNSSPVSPLADGPYRRVNAKAIAPSFNNGGPNITPQGDARDDYVAIEWTPNGNNASASVTATPQNISDQLGSTVSAGPLTINFQLSAGTNGNNTVFTARDMSAPTQILDAGKDASVNVGGPEIFILFKNGTAQPTDIVCDRNMWFPEGAGTGDADYGITYGIHKFEVTTAIQRVIALYGAGSSGMGSQAAIDAACLALNPAGSTPIRNADTGAVTAPNSCTSGGVGDYACTATRQSFTVGLVAHRQSFLGDEYIPVNATSCTLPARICDDTEAAGTPAAPSGNSCSGVGGGFGGLDVTVSNNITNNASLYIKSSGGSTIWPSP